MPTATSRAPTRDVVFDVLRGCCATSMALGHSANQSKLSLVTHLPKWVDGAYGFVGTSGLVLGLVDRRTISRDGVGASQLKLLRRVGKLYALHVVSLLVVIAVVSRGHRVLEVRSFHELGGGLEAVARVVLLRYQPLLFDILPMYVVLLAVLATVLPLLAKGHLVVVAAASAVAYGVSITWRDMNLADPALNVQQHVGWNLGGWQLVFFGGVLLGWVWSHERLAVPAPVRRWAVVGCVAVAAVLFLAARGGGDSLQHDLGWWVSKQRAGLLAVIDAAALLTTGYVLVRWAFARWARLRGVLTPIERLGAKSLVAFVSSSLLICAWDLFDPLDGVSGSLKGVVVLVLTYAIAEAFRTYDGRTWRVPLAVQPA